MFYLGAKNKFTNINTILYRKKYDIKMTYKNDWAIVLKEKKARVLFPKKITKKVAESFACSCDRRPRTIERSVIGCYILNNRPRAL